MSRNIKTETGEDADFEFDPDMDPSAYKLEPDVITTAPIKKQSRDYDRDSSNRHSSSRRESSSRRSESSRSSRSGRDRHDDRDSHRSRDSRSSRDSRDSRSHRDRSPRRDRDRRDRNRDGGSSKVTFEEKEASPPPPPRVRVNKYWDVAPEGFEHVHGGFLKLLDLRG